MSKKKIAIDADHILYDLASPPSEAWRSKLQGKSIVKADADIGKLKAAFKQRIQEYVDIAQVESVVQQWKLGKTVVVISDESNFRYDIFPEYKANRKGRVHTDAFLKLRKWARKKYAPKQNVEADDVVAWHVRNGAIGFSTDKDLLKGVPGIWFDSYHSRMEWAIRSEEDAYLFNLVQCIMGDSGDGIKGIPGVGVETATKLLSKHGWNYNGVISAYQQHGLTHDDALLTHRLVSMKQWSPAKGVRLHKKVK